MAWSAGFMISASFVWIARARGLRRLRDRRRERCAARGPRASVPGSRGRPRRARDASPCPANRRRCPRPAAVLLAMREARARQRRGRFQSALRLQHLVHGLLGADRPHPQQRRARSRRARRRRPCPRAASSAARTPGRERALHQHARTPRATGSAPRSRPRAPGSAACSLRIGPKPERIEQAAERAIEAGHVALRRTAGHARSPKSSHAFCAAWNGCIARRRLRARARVAGQNGNRVRPGIEHARRAADARRARRAGRTGRRRIRASARAPAYGAQHRGPRREHRLRRAAPGRGCGAFGGGGRRVRSRALRRSRAPRPTTAPSNRSSVRCRATPSLRRDVRWPAAASRRTARRTAGSTQATGRTPPARPPSSCAVFIACSPGGRRRPPAPRRSCTTRRPTQAAAARRRVPRACRCAAAGRA